MKNFGKNLLIAFLMILAIYQTTKLWFENYSSHNFFSLFLLTDSSVKADIYGLDRLIISFGDNRTVSQLENVMDTSYRKAFDDIIGDVISKGEMGTGQVDWARLMNNRCVVYDFGYAIKTDDLKKALDVSKASLKTEDIDEINCIVLIPNQTEKMAEVYLANNSKTVCYTLKREDTAQKGIDAINSISNSENSINYISSRGNGFNIFSHNIFIPTPSNSTISQINIENPVMDGNLINTQLLDDSVNGFFANPALKWSSLINNVYSFSDENNVVKYNLNGVLEYSGFNTANSDLFEKQTVMESYVVAKNFLKNDNSINNAVVLTGITQQQDNIVFNFDYAVDDVIAYLSDDMKKGLDLNSAIEVSVSRGSVSRYRRYMCVLTKSGAEKSIESDFINAIDNVYSKLSDTDNTDNQIDFVSLAYQIKSRENNVPVQWRVDINDKTYWEAA